MNMEGGFVKPNAEASEKIKFPHGEYGINEYEKEYGSENTEKVREIFDTFLNQEIANLQIYKSEKFGVSFPYTRIDMNNFTKELYEKATGKKSEVKNQNNNEKRTVNREFIFPGAPLKGDLSDNGPFHFAGESMHQCIGRLPSALEKIENSEEPDPFEVFMLGTPVNELGTMTPEFLEKFKKDPTRVMADVFAEFIEKDFNDKKNENDKLNIELYGISWGGGVSAITGEKLLESDNFTQDLKQAKEKEKPKIIIRAQNPVSLSRSKIKGPQIWLGATLNDIVSGDKYGPTMGKENPGFIKQINSALAKKGIHPDLSPEQQKMKKSAILDVVLSFRKGVVLKPKTIVNEIYGLNDLTTKSRSLTKEVKGQKEFHNETLGQNLAIPKRENSRVFGVDTFHEIPWFRENELRRINKAVEKLKELQEKI
ncbi:MAG: hypothetical protein WCG45_00500 [bacterium]